MVTGYTTGVYDLFHVGHLRVLERAKQECEYLIVGVTTDALSLERKKKKPVIPYEERVEIVSSIRWVDEVVPQASMDKFKAWEMHKFNRMFVGDDWRGTHQWDALEKEFSELDVEILYFPYTGHTSSTRLAAALDALQ